MLLVAVVCSMGLLRDGGSYPGRRSAPVALTQKLDDQFAPKPTPLSLDRDQKPRGRPRRDGRGARKPKAGKDIFEGLNIYNGIDLPPNIDGELE